MRKKIPNTKHEVDESGIVYRTEPGKGTLKGFAHKVRCYKGGSMYVRLHYLGAGHNINLEAVYRALFGKKLVPDGASKEERMAKAARINAMVETKNYALRMGALEKKGDRDIDDDRAKEVQQRMDSREAAGRAKAVAAFMEEVGSRIEFDHKYNSMRSWQSGLTFAHPEMNPFPL